MRKQRAEQGAGPQGVAQGLTSVTSSRDQPRDHKEHISKQVQEIISYFKNGLLAVEILILHEV